MLRKKPVVGAFIIDNLSNPWPKLIFINIFVIPTSMGIEKLLSSVT